VTREIRRLPVHDDERGSLLPVELGDVGFPVARVFVVTGPDGGAWRGDHGVPCRELVVLVTGRAEVRVRPRPESASETFVLDRPGEAIELRPGDSMEYHLTDGLSTILVLADAPYDAGRA
jgi:hypothetical protein